MAVVNTMLEVDLQLVPRACLQLIAYK